MGGKFSRGHAYVATIHLSSFFFFRSDRAVVGTGRERNMRRLVKISERGTWQKAA